MLVIVKVCSQPYVNVGLLLAAAGAWQFSRLLRRRGADGDAEDQPREERAGDKAVTALWLLLLMLWAASLVYLVFIR